MKEKWDSRRNRERKGDWKVKRKGEIDKAKKRRTDLELGRGKPETDSEKRRKGEREESEEEGGEGGREGR